MRRLLPLVLLTSCIINEGTDRLIDKSDQTVPVDGVERLVVDATNGSLEIAGEERGDVHLEAEFWGEVYNDDSAAALLKNLRLTHEVTDGVLTVKVRTGEGSLGEDGWINLKLAIPAALPVDVVDRSGDIVLQGVSADVSIEDRWGDIEIADVGGTLSIADSSGEIQVRNVGGACRIEDSSGDIVLKGAAGSVVIDDSWGDIVVTNVGGSVLIDDGSGDITVRVVEGDFEVTSNRRGDIEYEDVKGTVKLPESRRRGG